MKAKIFNEEEKKEIIDEYINTTIGIEKLALKYCTGKIKIKEILINANIPFKPKGSTLSGSTKSKDANENYKNKLIPSEGKKIIAICKETGKIFNDYLNLSGALTEHISKEYGIISPNNFFKKKYLKENKTYWHEQFFILKEIDLGETYKCKYCEWETIDLENKSGMFNSHLLNIHNKTVEDFIKEFPVEIEYFNKYNSKLKRDFKLLNIDNFKICKICGEKFESITTTHLKLHNITTKEYKNKYGDSSLMSKSLNDKFNKILRKANEDMIPTYESKSEKEIKIFLESIGVKADKNRKLLKGKEIDLVITDKKIGIEFNGNKWHTEIFGKKHSTYHLDKTKSLFDLGYALIHIFEDEWVLKQDIVKSKLSHILGISIGIKIGGRNCKILKINHKISSEFLEKYHIQGKITAQEYYGAFFNNLLIGVCTFNKKRDMTPNAKTSYDWELTRFATHNDYNIMGLGSKFLSHFIKEYNPNSIVSFADRRWTNEITPTLYDRMGFIKDTYIKPAYWYYKGKEDRYRRFHRFNYGLNNLKLKGLYSEGLTEWQCMQNHGWDRIWDCGLIRYVWKKQ